MGLTDRLQHAWNAFFNKDPTGYNGSLQYGGYISTSKPDRIRIYGGAEKTIITAIYNRIAVDVASTTIEHVRLDDSGRYSETINDGLNNCLTLEANKDQTARSFFIDVVMSMFDEGCVAIVPIDTDINPKMTTSYEIYSMRTGRILEWYPDAVRVRIYNDRKGIKEDVLVPKYMTAIVENPFYSVMNESNSMIKRLTRKLALLDSIDEHNSSGKLDLIIQLPYVIKTERQQEQAEKRRKDIEMQLAGSKYGIAYTDGTEHITQLNRAVDNNLLTQVQYLTSMLYGQLGITEEILNGTADEKTMQNYYTRTIEPIVAAITDELKRKFISKAARAKKQSIFFYQDPFKLVPVDKLAESADKFTRNEIMTSNEFRQIIGLHPSKDPNADVLRNKNLNASSATPPVPINSGEEGEIQNGG